MSGKIVLFEGADGSGKSTLLNEVQKALTRKKMTSRQFAFPSKEGLIGKLIREKLFTRHAELEDQRAMLYLMLADALDQDVKVNSWRWDFDWVLLDRHGMVSAWAYQADDGHTVATLAAATDPSIYAAAPDLIFILDVPAEVAIERRRQRDLEPNTLFEKDLAHAEKLRSRYAAYAGMYVDSGPIILLDGTLPTAELVVQVLQILDELG